MKLKEAKIISDDFHTRQEAVWRCRREHDYTPGSPCPEAPWPPSVQVRQAEGRIFLSKQLRKRSNLKHWLLHPRALVSYLKDYRSRMRNLEIDLGFCPIEPGAKITGAATLKQARAVLKLQGPCDA